MIFFVQCPKQPVMCIWYTNLKYLRSPNFSITDKIIIYVEMFTQFRFCNMKARQKYLNKLLQLETNISHRNKSPISFVSISVPCIHSDWENK